MFIKEGPDKRGKTHIIEGDGKPNNEFHIKRFVCEVQQQETEEETEKLAEFLVKKLNA